LRTYEQLVERPHDQGTKAAHNHVSELESKISRGGISASLAFISWTEAQRDPEPKAPS
jgi:hypothetical protein